MARTAPPDGQGYHQPMTDSPPADAPTAEEIQAVLGEYLPWAESREVDGMFQAAPASPSAAKAPKMSATTRSFPATGLMGTVR